MKTQGAETSAPVKPMSQVAAVDIGTSGIRCQLLDPGTGKVLRTCITAGNPLPGSNVMDHMSFAITYGIGLAHSILSSAVKETLLSLKPEGLTRIAVCGNPIQLSIFEGIGIKDLAFAGENRLAKDDVVRYDRVGHVIDGEAVGFPGVEVYIPPAVKHEIGADALAMMLKSGFLDDDLCMVTDYGTNAEMALKVGNTIYTGSAAAGPAMEGQQIGCGMIAGPDVVSDMVRTPQGWRTVVLDNDLMPVDGPLINLRSGIYDSSGRAPQGITGTGVVAMVYGFMQDSLNDDSEREVKVSRRIYFNTDDYREAGKAIGAIRAGHLTLMIKAGIDPSEIHTMYMAGASGTYVDPIKAKYVGMVPPTCTKVVQVGNTSIELAKDLVLHPELLEGLNEMRRKLSSEHVMFASSDVFRELYLMEYGYWNDGMPLNRYRRTLERYGIEGYLDNITDTDVERICIRDIRDIGESLSVYVPHTRMEADWDCSRCGNCQRGCPGKALTVGDRFSIDTRLCLGTACLRCEENCPEKRYDYSAFRIVP